MKFNVIIGNPPYQEMAGGGSGTESSNPLYNKFILDAIDIEPKYISMIIPSRWLSGGVTVLNNFRNSMIQSNHLSEVHHFDKASDIFDGVNIAGGVMYFLWENGYNSDITKFYTYSQETLEVEMRKRSLSEYKYRDRYGKDQFIVVLDNIAIDIIKKIKSNKTFIDTALPTVPFGLRSDFEDSIECTDLKPIRVLCGNKRITYTSIDAITQNKWAVDKWKVICGYKSEGASKGISNKVIYSIGLLRPNEACSISYLVLNTFDCEFETLNAEKYIKTQFVRFLVSVTLSGMGLSYRNFIFVPVQDYTENSDIDWSKSINDIDEQLFNKYSLTDSERRYIKSKIKPME